MIESPRSSNLQPNSSSWIYIHTHSFGFAAHIFGLGGARSSREAWRWSPQCSWIQLVVVGVLRNHHVVGIESAFHHPLALENLLFHCFESCFHSSGPPWSLDIADVHQPITHLNCLRVLQHLREVGIDNLLEELVLGGAWRRHDDLDLSEKIARNKNRGYLRGTVVKTFRRLYNEFLPTKRSIVQENGVRRAHEVGGALIRLQHIYNFWLLHAILPTVLDIIGLYYPLLYYFLD